MLLSLLRSNKRVLRRDTHITHPFSFEIVRMTYEVVLILHESCLFLSILPTAEVLSVLLTAGVLLVDSATIGSMPVV